MPTLKTFRTETGAPSGIRRWTQAYLWVRTRIGQNMSGGSKSPPLLLRRRIAETRKLHQRQEVIEALRRSDLKRLQPVVYGDGSLTSLPMDVWQEILKWSDIDRIRYVRDQRTCSNFALGLAGQVAMRCGVDGCGAVVDFSGGHAYCCLLVQDGQGGIRIALVEPQSDRTPTIGDRLSGHEAYKAERGFVLFA